MDSKVKDFISAFSTAFGYVPKRPNTLKTTILLTDGAIRDPREVINMTMKRCKADNRLFVLGVGSGVNSQMIKALSKAGQGSC